MKRRQFLSATAAGAAGWFAAQQVQGEQSEEPGQAARAPDRSGAPPQADALPEITWSRKVPVRYVAEDAEGYFPPWMTSWSIRSTPWTPISKRHFWGFQDKLTRKSQAFAPCLGISA